MSALALVLTGFSSAVVASTGVGLIFSANAQSTAEKLHPLVSVAPLQTALLPSDTIGSRRSGWLCVPAGSTLWRDAAPDPQATAEAVHAALMGSSAIPGERVPWAGSSANAEMSSFVLSGKVISASVQACSPQWGMGKLLSDKRTIKGRGELKVSWTIYRRLSSSIVDACETSHNFTFNGSTALPEILKLEVTRTVQARADRIAAAARDPDGNRPAGLPR